MKLPFFKKTSHKLNIFTIAFYNVENLFDTYDDTLTNDDDFLPSSEKRWSKKRYKKKVYKLGTAISQIGNKRSGKSPAIVGLAEVENEVVLNDLINSRPLRDDNYGFVHYDSPDERGIDVALLYKKELFKILKSEPYTIDITKEGEEPDYTRDILLVEGELNGELIYILINHWSSRREGAYETEFKRIIAAEKVMEIISTIQQENNQAKIIVMGDFNDDPDSKSIQKLTKSMDLYNPMETLLSYTRGSLNYKFKWNIFDQIMITTNFFETKEGSHSFSKADIYDQKFLSEYKGKFKGQPFRTYVGLKYKGGYSDHFPVFIQLKKN